MTENVIHLSNEKRKMPIYMDYQATTPMDPRVLDAMTPYFIERFGNPHSRSHAYGWETEDAVETARKQVADVIGANPKEIVFILMARLFTAHQICSLPRTRHSSRLVAHHLICRRSFRLSGTE